MSWKKVCIDGADYLGRVENVDPNFMHLTKLKNDHSTLFSNCFSVSKKLGKAREELQEINDEIEAAHTKHNLHKANEPWLPVTLQEFLQYKALEREVTSLQQVEQFYQKMAQKVVAKLAETKSTLVHSVKLLKVYTLYTLLYKYVFIQLV